MKDQIVFMDPDSVVYAWDEKLAILVVNEAGTVFPVENCCYESFHVADGDYTDLRITSADGCKYYFNRQNADEFIIGILPQTEYEVFKKFFDGPDVEYKVFVVDPE